MTQTRKQSAIEALANVAIGYTIASLANYFILPLFGYNVTLRDSFAISLAFTAVSMVRSYLLRRLFNKWSARKCN